MTKPTTVTIKTNAFKNEAQIIRGYLTTATAMANVDRQESYELLNRVRIHLIRMQKMLNDSPAKG